MTFGRTMQLIVLVYITGVLLAGCRSAVPQAAPTAGASRTVATTPTTPATPTATSQPISMRTPTVPVLPHKEQSTSTRVPLATPTATFTPQLAVDNTAHPYLLFNQGDLAQYKQEIDQAQNFRYELFTELADYLPRAEEPSMLPSAFYYLLTQDETHLDIARELLLEETAQDCWDPSEQYCQRDRIAGNRLGRVSLAYDWLHNELSSAERNQVKDRIATEVCRLYEAFTYGKNNTAERWGNWWLTDYTQNHFHSVVGGMVLGALAIKDDAPPTCTATDQDGQQTTRTNQQILDFGLQKMQRNYLIFNRITDGSYPEGDSYVTAYTETYLPALWATNRLLASDLIREQRLRAYPLFFLFNAPPGQLWNRLTNYGDYFTSSRENYWFARDLRLIATIHQDSLANWLASHYYYDKDGRVKIYSDNSIAAYNVVLDFIFMDPTLTPQSPTDIKLDLSYHAEDWEGVFMRSDWTESAVAAALKVGPPGGHVVYNIARSNQLPSEESSPNQEPTEFDLTADHMHADANGIYLYANNTFLLPEMHGYLEKTPWGRYTSSHNTILVSDAQGHMRGQIQGDAIGGATLGYRWLPGREYFWDIETPQSEVGIIEHASTAGYDYSLGQATGAYWPELGLTRFHRHVLFVREPGYVLVVDDLAANSEKIYDWMGHSTGTVTQEGNWLKVYADNNQRLAVAILSANEFDFIEPTNTWENIELKDLYTFRYVSQNRTMYEWRIRQICQACHFVTLLVPTDETHWMEKPTVTRLSDTDELVAVEVEFETKTDTLALNLTPGETQTVQDIAFDGRTAAVEKSGSTVSRVLLVGGSTLQVGTTPFIKNLAPTSFLEAIFEGSELILRGTQFGSITLYAPEITAASAQTVDENNRVITRLVSFSRNGDYITLTP